ncbi:hypothetical protein BROUX41_001504 [Berkeleyomyces rouxiae]|uniref:uncharacterized protein n=1 Tax=Berkeleyomyces rouxiae TaxID=2035830 RepID=UPI003B7F8920
MDVDMSDNPRVPLADTTQGTHTQQPPPDSTEPTKSAETPPTRTEPAAETTHDKNDKPGQTDSTSEDTQEKPGRFTQTLEKATSEALANQKISLDAVQALTRELDTVFGNLEGKVVNKTAKAHIKDIAKDIQDILRRKAHALFSAGFPPTEKQQAKDKPAPAQETRMRTETRAKQKEQKAGPEKATGWANMAAAGTTSHQTFDVRGPRQANKPQQKTRATPPPNRLLVRLFEGSRWKNVNATIVRNKINMELFSGKEQVAQASSTATGFALLMTENEAAENPESLELIRNYMDAEKIEKECTWEKFIIPNVPKTINALDKEGACARRVTLEDVKADVQKAFGGDLKIIMWREYPNDPDMQGLRVAIKDPERTPNTITLLGQVKVVRRAVQKPLPPPRCQRCWRAHRTELCSYAIRCARCGEKTHTTDFHHQAKPCKEHPGKRCDCTSNCAICKGQHSAETCINQKKN